MPMATNKPVKNGSVYADLNKLTHALKGTVGIVRMVAASKYVEEPARELLERAASRLQASYQAYETTMAQLDEEALVQ